MNVSIRCKPAYAMAVCQLRYHERVFVERKAMAAMSEGMHVVATTGGTGVVRGLVRQVTVGEPLVFTAFTAEVEGAWVAVTPKFPGDVSSVPVTDDEPLVVQAGGILAYSEGLAPELRYGGVRKVLMQEGLLFSRMRGNGTLVVASYGGMEETVLHAGQQMVVDTGHLVAFSDAMRYEIGPLTGVTTSALTGELLVGRFTGPGRVIVQTRSEHQFRDWLFPNRR